MTRPPSHHRLFGSSFEASWFTGNGPHGPHFSWHREIHGYSALEHLRSVIAEQTGRNPGFSTAVRDIALQAISLGDTTLMRRAIQVLCVVGTDDDLVSLGQLSQHPNESLRKDLRACLFIRGFKKHHP